MLDAAAVKAVILAGGRGRRLAPCVAFPKPLVPVGDRAVLEIHSSARWSATGSPRSRSRSTTSPSSWMAYVGGQPELRDLARHRFVRDVKPSGTAGPLARIDGLDETFLVCNGDLLTGSISAPSWPTTRPAARALTVAVHRKPVPLGLGVLDVTPTAAWRRTPRSPCSTTRCRWASTSTSPAPSRTSRPASTPRFPRPVARLLAARRARRRRRNDAYWLDIGNPDDYARAQEDAAAGRSPGATA